MLLPSTGTKVLRQYTAQLRPKPLSLPKCRAACHYPSWRLYSEVSPATFHYRVVSAYTGKKYKFNPSIDFHNHTLTPPAPSACTGKPRSGQDAFFASTLARDPDNVAFGVTDGVGGWEQSGIDPAIFSHALCRQLAFCASTRVAKPDMTPTRLLQSAYNRIITNGNIRGGGSTACVAIARKDGLLQVANLGDSGYMHIRLGAIRYVSRPQTHAFNTPFQLSVISAREAALSRLFGGGHLHDMPSDAETSECWVQHGDVLVFATDGVWDNLFHEDVLRIVGVQMDREGAWIEGKEGLAVAGGLADKTAKRESVQEKIALELAAMAERAGGDEDRDGPFAREVQANFPKEGFRGGKQDDVCLIVALVVQEGM